jgi:hypothetical protein
MQVRSAWHYQTDTGGSQDPRHPGGSNGRKARRYPIQLPVLHNARTPGVTRPGVAWTRNLSEGGACLELAEPLPPRARLWLCLRTDRGVIEAEGLVAWSGQAPRGEEGGVPHGVAFAHLGPAEAQALWELIVSKGMVRPAGIRLPLQVPVTWEPKGQAGASLPGRTRDISRGGLLLHLPHRLPPETTLALTLHTSQGPLCAEGTIVWVAPPEMGTPGGSVLHGVRFIGLGWSSLLALGLSLMEPS